MAPKPSGLSIFPLWQIGSGAEGTRWTSWHMGLKAERTMTSGLCTNPWTFRILKLWHYGSTCGENRWRC